MRRVLYLDPEIIEYVKTYLPNDTDPEIVDVVNEGLDGLDPDIREIMRERYFEGLTLAMIAERHGVDEKKIIRSIYEGKRILKMKLADFVRRRWGIIATGICRICGHPRRSEIEAVLKEAEGSRSWAGITRQIERLTGERFHPPQVLKAHLKHMSIKEGESRERR